MTRPFGAVCADACDVESRCGYADRYGRAPGYGSLVDHQVVRCEGVAFLVVIVFRIGLFDIVRMTAALVEVVQSVVVFLDQTPCERLAEGLQTAALAGVFRLVVAVILTLVLVPVFFFFRGLAALQAGQPAQLRGCQKAEMLHLADEGAEEDTDAGFAVVVIKVELLLCGLAMANRTRDGFDPFGRRTDLAQPSGGCQQAQDGRHTKSERADNRRGTAGHVVRDERREVVNGVAEEAAETGRQRPAFGNRQGGQGTCGKARADQPVDQALAADAKHMTGQKPPAPQNQRHQEHGGCQADGLHQNVGKDCAGRTERVTYLAAGGVVLGSDR